MKITIARDALLPALTVAASIAPTNSVIPILGTVLLQPFKGGLVIRATSLDLEISLPVKATMAEPGSGALPARDLLDLTKSFPSGAEIEIEVDERGVNCASMATVRCGRGCFVLPSRATADFPIMPDQTKAVSIELDARALLSALDVVEFAISDDESLVAFCGVCVIVDGGKLVAVATDKQRLARAIIGEAPKAWPEKGIIIGGAHLAPLRRALAEAHTVSAHVDQRLDLDFDGKSFRCRLIDAEYPDFRRIVPKANGRHVDFRRSDLEPALRRALTLTEVKEVQTAANKKISPIKARSVRVEVTPLAMRLVGAGSDGRQINEEIVATATADVSFSVNLAYFIDSVRGMEDEEISLHFTEPLRPFLLLPVGQKDTDSAHHFIVQAPYVA